MPGFYLSEQQNAVTNAGLNGEVIEVPTRVEVDGKSFWKRWADFYRRDF